jgi:hypothetical protein
MATQQSIAQSIEQSKLVVLLSPGHEHRSRGKNFHFYCPSASPASEQAAAKKK